MSNEVGQISIFFPHCVQKIRSWEDRYLPVSQSRIAFDLFVLIARSTTDDQPLTVKELLNSLKYSQRGIRNILNQFVDGGWCEVVGHEKDRRFRLVIATDLFRGKLQEYEAHVMNIYANHLSVLSKDTIQA